MFIAIMCYNSVREVFILRATILIVQEQTQTTAFLDGWQNNALSLYLLVAFLDLQNGVWWEGNVSKSVGKVVK